MQFGYGIFMWDGFERRSNRYGTFYPSDATLDAQVHTQVQLDETILKPLVGQRVRVTATIRENRDSGHVGDAFLGIQPSRPEEGERIEIGVGVLVLGTNHLKATTIGLRPEDGRPDLWIDPRTLYRLHDQTVDLDIEPTTDPCSPVPLFTPVASGAISNGDGTFQTKGIDPTSVYLPPKIERLGDGMFAVSPPALPAAGQRVPTKPSN